MTNRERTINAVSLQPVDQRRDRALLDRWLHAPHVIRWWGDPDKAIQEIFEPAMGGCDALIMVGSIPVGYIRWQVPSQDELSEAGLGDIPENTVDIDIVIGESNFIGRGIAAQSLRLLVSRLSTSETIPLIIACTSVENGNAIRALEKAGFERKRIFDDPKFGDMWLLTTKPMSKGM